MVFVIGLTGGIGSGKTAVSDRFAELGVTIADADVSARTVVEPGTPALAKIADHFGESVLLPEGSLDRTAVRKIVFSDPEERKWLESVTVPAILEDLRSILNNAESSYAILMLSSGSGQSPWIHRNLVVDVPEEIQISRVTSRDSTDEAGVRAIMATQPSRQARLDYADDVIDNTESMYDLDQRIAELHAYYLTLAAQHEASS
jgi:dephospho-CoA kinase